MMIIKAYLWDCEERLYEEATQIEAIHTIVFSVV